MSPYFKLFQKEPDYSNLRIFGCACYPLLRPYASHKLSFWSKQCIFIGYSLNQRGYRCLDPISKRIYVSRHVVFDEGFFPARDTRTAAQQPSTVPPIQVCPTFSSPGSNLHSIPTAPQYQDHSSLPLPNSPSNNILQGPPIPPTPAHSMPKSLLPSPLHVSPSSTPLSPSLSEPHVLDLHSQELESNSTSLVDHVLPNTPQAFLVLPPLDLHLPLSLLLIHSHDIPWSLDLRLGPLSLNNFLITPHFTALNTHIVPLALSLLNLNPLGSTKLNHHLSGVQLCRRSMMHSSKTRHGHFVLDHHSKI